MFESTSELALYATRNVRFYREYRGEKFERLPIIGKRQIRASFSSFASEKCPPSVLEYCESLSRVGCAAAEKRYESWYAERSSGTTGPAVWYPRDKLERIHAAMQHYRMRQQLIAGFSPARMEDLNELYARRLLSTNELHPFSVYPNLQKRGIRHIYGQLHLVASHARSLRGADRSFEFNSIEVGGAYPEEEMRRTIEAAFRGRVVCQYGCREVFAIGYSVPEHSAEPSYRLMPTVHVELVDQEGQQIEEPGLSGRVVVSSLILSAFPIIRFDTGDIGMWYVDGHESERRLVLEPERESGYFVQASGLKTAGTGLFKRFFSDVRTEDADFVRGEWKVRLCSDCWEIYLQPKDMVMANAIRAKFQQHKEVFGDRRVSVREWEGWGETDKRVLFSQM